MLGTGVGNDAGARQGHEEHTDRLPVHPRVHMLQTRLRHTRPSSSPNLLGPARAMGGRWPRGVGAEVGKSLQLPLRARAGELRPCHGTRREATSSIEVRAVTRDGHGASPGSEGMHAGPENTGEPPVDAGWHWGTTHQVEVHEAFGENGEEELWHENLYHRDRRISSWKC